MGLAARTWLTPPVDPPARGWRDWVLLLGVAIVVAAETVLRTDVPPQWPWAVVLVAVAVTTLWRRRFPTAMLAIALGVAAVAGQVIATDLALISSIYVLTLVYAVPRWGSRRSMLAGGVLMLLAVMVPSLVGSAPWADAGGSAAVVLATGALGLAFRWRAAARAREMEQVRLLEAERLARDLHDTVAHHVSAIAVRAQAARAVAASQSPAGGLTPTAAASDALRVIEDEATRALEDMRSIVRILRRDEPELAPARGIADLKTLAGSDPAVPMHVEVTGDPSAVPAPVGAAVYRIAQEALTNVRRHARGATRAILLVHIDTDQVTLEIRDDGSPTHAPPSGGYGIAGMTERADMLGGYCSAGPGPDGGWVVAATLPLAGSHW
ncbi:sensor histidine kinase [Ruania alkalisoli]|uniref:histidine kinase n=1 Tax=Ruania alkalisoli TaxID=2779775 RepID=A0A7M1SZN3_9MICO|nr:histidine kinase [Ruania alkalisoli]QOR72202.1 sensor histidine kinase [Ruania alkalisoli]